MKRRVLLPLSCCFAVPLGIYQPQVDAVNTSFDGLHAQGRYYAAEHGVWFVADSALGPWAAAADIAHENIFENLRPDESIVKLRIRNLTQDIGPIQKSRPKLF